MQVEITGILYIIAYIDFLYIFIMPVDLISGWKKMMLNKCTIMHEIDKTEMELESQLNIRGYQIV
jgi:hypothetical protein